MSEMANLQAKKPEVNIKNSASRIQINKISQTPISSAEHILFLQRTIGNQAVQRLIKSGAFQAKLTVNPPGDIYEQEADRVAKQVVSQMKSSDIQLQAIPKEEEEEEKLMKKDIVQLNEANGGWTAAPELENSIQQARGSGQPLPENMREPMETAFGADFSGVRVHTDADSDMLNKSLHSQAFTTGRNIFFRQGEYNPRSSGGQELIAHELTHVMQQMQERGVLEYVDNRAQSIAQRKIKQVNSNQKFSRLIKQKQGLLNTIIQIKGTTSNVIQRQGGYIPSQNSNYTGLGHNLCSPGTDFSQHQRTAILGQNQGGAVNVGLVYHDDRNNNPLGTYAQVAAVDHIYPASLGGVNAYYNAQVIDAATNSGAQRNAYPSGVRTPGYNGSRLYIGHPVNVNLPYNVGQTNIPTGTILNINGNGAGAMIDMTPVVPLAPNPNNRWSQVSLGRSRNYGILTINHNPL